MPKLTEEQIQTFRNHRVLPCDATPARFLYKGRSLDVCTGELLPPGTNIINQKVYWNFTKYTSQKIAKILGCEVIFDTATMHC